MQINSKYVVRGVHGSHLQSSRNGSFVIPCTENRGHPTDRESSILLTGGGAWEISGAWEIRSNGG